ncbi:hypothetical protein GCM10027053_47750 [Intrasporangium mesophilum]
MSTTTALNLLERADVLTRQLRGSTVPTTSAQWDTFDVTLHRLLLEFIGPDASRVRAADPTWRPLHLAIRTYPSPLRPPIDAHLTPAVAARYTNLRPQTLRYRIRRGHLRSVKDGENHLIHSQDLDTRPDIRPADPTDEHPLARISCTLGALADLIHDNRHADQPILSRNGEAAGAAQHVLTLAAVAARHTIAHGSLDDAVRPLLVGRYAERVIDSLRDGALRPLSLDRAVRIAPEANPASLHDQLEAALHHWHTAALTELRRSIPSIDVLGQIANQGAHICDVRSRVRPTPMSTIADDHLRVAARALSTGERAWGRLTTLASPSHEFVASSRDLFGALRAVSFAVQKQDPSLDLQRVTANLDRGLTVVAELMTATRTLPDRLLVANILRAPALAVRATDDRLLERTRRRYVQVRVADESIGALKGGMSGLF